MMVFEPPHGKTNNLHRRKQTAKLISAFVFATRIVQFLFYLNPKFQASSSFLCVYRPVCVGPVRKPHCWFSHEAAHLSDFSAPCPESSHYFTNCSNPCEVPNSTSTVCKSSPGAVCRPDYCGGCIARFYDTQSGQEINCEEGKLSIVLCIFDHNYAKRTYSLNVSPLENLHT